MTVITNHEILYSDKILLRGSTYSIGNYSGTGGAFSTNKYTLTTEPGKGWVVFDGNTASENGGAIYITGTGNNKFSHVQFNKNKAGLGGAVYVAGACTVTITDSIFKNNTSTQAGALTIYNSNSNVTLTNVQFIGNSATDNRFSNYAGAIYLVQGTLTIRDCYFSGNTSAKDGGAGAIGVTTTEGTKKLVFQGHNILEKESDSIYIAGGNVFFDLTDKTAYDSAKSVLNHFNYIQQSADNPIYIQVTGTQVNDVYVVANDASNAGSTGDKLSNLRVLVDGTNVNGNQKLTIGEVYKHSNISYSLQKTADNDLVLVVGDNFVFVNNSYKSWEEEPIRTATYHGAPFSGVEDDNRYFDAFQAGVAQAKGITGKLVGVDAGTVNYSVSLECVSAELTSGNFKKLVIGGAIVKDGSVTASTASTDLMITGGTYDSNVIGGDYARDGKSAQTLEKSNLVITGGVFNYAVAAGSYANNNPANSGNGSVAVGNVSLTISGGTFAKRVYGGNYAYNDSAKASISTISGDVNIVINVGDSPIVLNDGLDAGSRGTGAIAGNVTVTFKGTVKDSTDDATSNLVFGEGAKIWGGCNRDTIMIMGDGTYKVSSQVQKDRLLLFDGFTDSAFEGKVAMFKSIKAVNNSQVTFACDALDTTIVENWTLGAGCSLEGLKKNDFTGDTLNLTYDGSGEDIVFSGAEGALNGWDKATVILNGKATEWSAEGQYWAAADAGVKLCRDGNALKLAALAAALA